MCVDIGVAVWVLFKVRFEPVHPTIYAQQRLDMPGVEVLQRDGVTLTENWEE